jgi:tetratricopeptide (TPR) repeat protein
MQKLFNRFRNFLGESRFWMLLGLLVSTGIASFALQFIETPNAVISQNVLALIFLVGTFLIIGSRMDAQQRVKWVSIIVPGLGLVILGMMFFPAYQGAFFGAAFGWVLVGLFVFGRSSAPLQYRTAIKALRKKSYQEAVDAMDDLIRIEPHVPNHYRFRAELLRLWGKLGRARRDYQEMLARSTDDGNRAVAYNGLAEVELQSGNYDPAAEAAQKAYELAPSEWVAAYNLGMIEDRRRNSEQVIRSLEVALSAKVPDARHRLLIYFYLIRAQARLGATDRVENWMQSLREHRKGLQEWQTILEDEQAAVLRQVLAADIQAIEKLLDGQLTVQELV